MLAEACTRGYGGIELFTAAENLRSRTFYDARGWRLLDADGYEHDGLWLVGYGRHMARDAGHTRVAHDN